MTDNRHEPELRREIPTDGGDLIEDSLKEYGIRVLQDHIPQSIDGLKTLYRRALWAGKDFPSSGIRSTLAVGQVRSLHDHGDVAIYDTLARMSQNFHFNPTFFDFKGSVGDKTSPQPASSRYTGLSLSQFSYAVFFKGIEPDALQMKRGMDFQMVEPQFLPPAIPISLLISNTTVGYGHGSKTPGRNLANICDLVEAYCAHLMNGGAHHTFDITKYSHLMLPDFAMPSRITNAPKLLSAYKSGDFNFPIHVEGIAEIKKDSISIKSLPIGISFMVVEKIRGAITASKNKKTETPANRWIEQNVVDAQSEPSGVTIVLRKNARPVFEVWENVKTLIDFKTTFHPNPNFVDVHGYPYTLTPKHLLEIWYRARYSLILTSKRRQLGRTANQLRILEAQLIVCDHTDDVLKIVRGSDSPSDAITRLTKRFPRLSPFQADHLTRVQIRALSKTSKESLHKSCEACAAQVEAQKAGLLKIPEEISAAAKEIKRLFAPTERTTIIPSYIGYVKTQGGCIQFEDPNEVEAILENFPNVPVEVYTYNGPNLVQVLNNGGIPKEISLSKYTEGDFYGLPFKTDRGYTVNISKDNTACCVKGVIPGLRSEGYFYTTKTAQIIRRTGTLESVDITQVVSMRKTICRGATTDIVYVYPGTKSQHYIIHMCDAEKNVIAIERIPEEGNHPRRIRMAPVGDIHILHHVTGENWYFSIPEKFTNRLGVRVFYIKDAEAVLGKSNRVRIELASKSWRRSPHLEYMS